MFGDAASRDAAATGGNDVFAFLADSGQDTVFDFEQGKDLIDVEALGYTAFGQLDIDPDGSGGSIVHFLDTNQVTVANVAILAATDFIFA